MEEAVPEVARPVTEDIIWRNATPEQQTEVARLLNRIPPETGIRIGEVRFAVGLEPSYAKVSRRLDLPSDKPIDPDVIYHEAAHGFPDEVMNKLIRLTKEAEPRALVAEEGIAVAFARYMTGVPARTEGSKAAVDAMKREFREAKPPAVEIPRAEPGMPEKVRPELEAQRVMDTEFFKKVTKDLEGKATDEIATYYAKMVMEERIGDYLRQLIRRYNLPDDSLKMHQRIKELAEAPAIPRAEAGEAIAKELNLRYEGIQEELGMQFTDIHGTGTTFYATSVEDAREKLKEKRRLFGVAEGGNPVKTEAQRKATHERIFGKGSTLPERLGRGQIVNDLMPMSPEQGPPLPRSLGIRWPWRKQ